MRIWTPLGQLSIIDNCLQLFCLPPCPANDVRLGERLCDGRASWSAGQTHEACVQSEGCVHTRQQSGNWLGPRQQGHPSPPEGGAESSSVWDSGSTLTATGASRDGHGDGMSGTRRGSIHEVGESSVAHTGRINRTLAGGSRSCRHTHLPPRLPCLKGPGSMPGPTTRPCC